jgi:hypothetical protein
VGCPYLTPSTNRLQSTSVCTAQVIITNLRHCAEIAYGAAAFDPFLGRGKFQKDIRRWSLAQATLPVSSWRTAPGVRNFWETFCPKVRTDPSSWPDAWSADFPDVVDSVTMGLAHEANYWALSKSDLADNVLLTLQNWGRPLPLSGLP